MKRFFLLLLALAGTCAAAAQPLVCTEPGTVLKYALYDGKGKLTGYRTVTVETCLPDSKGELEVTALNELFDTKWRPVTAETPDGDELSSETRTVTKVRDNEMVFSIDSFFSDMAGMGVNALVAGDEWSIPFEAPADTALPDRFITVKLVDIQSGRSLDLRIEITERKVLAREQLNTPAGLFPTVKIVEKTTMIMMVNESQRLATWYAPGIGVVREETLSRKEKVEEYTELIAIEKPKE